MTRYLDWKRSVKSNDGCNRDGVLLVYEFAMTRNDFAQDTMVGRVVFLVGSAGDGGDEHDLVAILEGVGFAAEEADVFVVDVDVNEAAELAVFALDLGGEGWEGLVDVGEEAREIFGGRVEVLAAVGVA